LYFAFRGYKFLAIREIFLAIAILSVRPSVTRVIQLKTLQARITKFPLLAAWKTA